MPMLVAEPADHLAARAAQPRTLIDNLLDEQRCLTAVEQYARFHEEHALPGSEPRYRSLLPASPPERGQQYAFEVDLDKCSGCKSCVAACHSLNGLDDGEAWRTVGTLVSDDWRRPFQQTITTACHHCVDPGCLHGCPVLAYEKDPATGIVRHLDDQCIGCQYCIIKCPYDAPKFSAKRGIVRKCDLCSQRLAVGEAPACVQACPNEAIRITIVEQENVRKDLRITIYDLRATERTNPFLPTSPDPAVTLPTTRFVSKKTLAPGLLPANAGEVRLQPAHAPLVWMLVLTQLGVGAFVLRPILGGAPSARYAQAQSLLAWAGLFATLLGLSGSVLHLGKPMKAWRSFLGWRKSWLSREVLVFGAFFLLAALTTALAHRSAVSQASSLKAAAILTALVGLAGVLCSGMVYHDTKRTLWLGLRSVGRFFATTAVLGLATAWPFVAAQGATPGWIPIAIAFATTIKLAGEHRLLRGAESDPAEEAWPTHAGFEEWSLAHSAALMRGRLGLLTRTRFFFGIAGGVLLPLLSLLPDVPALALAGIAAGLCLLGELAERYLFFRCVVPPRMPGGEVAHA